MATPSIDHFPDGVGFAHGDEIGEGICVRFRGEIQRPRFGSTGAAQAYLDGLRAGTRAPEPETRTHTDKGWKIPSVWPARIIALVNWATSTTHGESGHISLVLGEDGSEYDVSPDGLARNITPTQLAAQLHKDALGRLHSFEVSGNPGDEAIVADIAEALLAQFGSHISISTEIVDTQVHAH